MTEKFVELLDQIQDQKNKQYIDFYHYMKMSDFYYFQQQLHNPLFCNDNQPAFSEPIKVSRNFDSNSMGLLS